MCIPKIKNLQSYWFFKKKVNLDFLVHFLGLILFLGAVDDGMKKKEY